MAALQSYPIATANPHGLSTQGVRCKPLLPRGRRAFHSPLRLTSPGKARYALLMRSTISSKGQVTVPVELREKLGLVPGMPVEFELREEGVLLRKGDSACHPVDKVWETLPLGRPVDDILDEMRGPRPRKP